MISSLNNKKEYLLVLTDFKKNSQCAANFALNLAFRLKCNILLFNSWFNPVTNFENFPNRSLNILAQKSKEELGKELKRLEAVMEGATTTTGFKPKLICLQGEGALCDNILHILSLNDVIMVILGGRKKNNDDLLFGLEINSILTHVPIPAVVVPEFEDF
ncbi:nucleotide-binding universal stress UspA family protein [Pedobacter sp. CG_S7]|uniref:universal stress protein n=1 Tax=Pedobacter sp. CG_S7 TaxID=3143930 RepID=UPI003393747D